MLFCLLGTLGTLHQLVGSKAAGRPGPSEGVRGLCGVVGGGFSVYSEQSGFWAILDSKDVCGDLVHIEYNIVFRGNAFYLENEHFTVHVQIMCCERCFI